MRKLIPFLLVFLLTVPSIATAEAPQDFGVNYTGFLVYMTAKSAIYSDDINFSDFTFDTDAGYVYFEYNDYSFFLYVNPQTRNIDRIMLSFPQSKIEENAQAYGNMVGSMLSFIVPSFTSNDFKQTASDLGMLSDSFLLSKEIQKNSVYDEAYSYNFAVVPTRE